MRAERAWLEAFVAVADGGSVGRAARELGRSQPSISNRLSELESAWSVRLFRREPRGMALTPEGERLLPTARVALEQLQALDRRATGHAGLDAPELRVGAGDALGRIALPRAIAELRREMGPELAVRVVEAPASRLLSALSEGEIDLALVLAPIDLPPHVELQPVLGSEVHLLFDASTRAVRPRSVGLEGLRDEPLVTLQRGSSFRRRLQNAWTGRALDFRPAVEVGNLSLVRRFVAAGLGVAPVPAVAFEGDEREGIGRCRLDGVGPLRYAAASRSGIALPAPSRELVRILAASG